MRIDENKVYMFTFDTGEMGNLAIPVRGENRDEAANTLQRMLGKMQSEIAMEFPRTSPTVVNAVGGTGSVSGIVPAEVLELRIDTLLADMGAKDLILSAKAQTIKNWTKLAFVPENYAEIIRELELIATGEKVVEAPPLKKGK